MKLQFQPILWSIVVGSSHMYEPCILHGEMSDSATMLHNRGLYQSSDRRFIFLIFVFLGESGVSSRTTSLV